MDEMQPASIDHPNRGRLRYWARLIKLLREPWPSRPTSLARAPEPARSPEPPRHPAPARLDDEA
jgi:hypothetical protein